MKKKSKEVEKLEEHDQTAGKSIIGMMASFLSQQDDYGQPIGFNYEGSDSYQTPYGGILSIISRLLVLVCFLYKITQLINS